MRNFFLILTCFLSLGNQLGMSGHAPRSLRETGSSEIAIETINTIGPNSAHNFTINAGAGITITPGTNSITITNMASGGVQGVAEFVVDSSGQAGYTTVQSAINAAAAVATSSIPQTVWIWPGTYTENIVVSPYVSLAAASSAEGGSSLGVVIIGHATCTPSIAGQAFAANNIIFEAAGGDAFTVDGTESCFVVFNGCTFNGAGGNCLTSTNTSTSSKIYQYNCVSNAASGHRIYSIGNNYLFLNSCNNTSTDTSSVLDAGQIVISGCNYIDCFTVTSGTLYVYSSSAAAFGSNSLFNVDGALHCFNSFFSTSAADWATGSGTIFYNAITAGAAQVGSGLTPTIQTLQVGDISFDGGVTVLNPTTLPSGEIVIGQGNSSLSSVASEPYGVLISDSSGVPSWLPNSSTNYVLTSTSGAPPSWKVAVSADAVSKFVVDSQGNAGYTTIQSAVDAALANSPVPSVTTPQTIWIWPGTYHEGGSLDLYPWVNLASAAGGVTITGTATYTTSASGEYFYCNGIEFAPTSGNAFTITGTGEPVLTFDRCTFNPAAGNCFFADNLSLTDPYTVYQNNCISNAASTYSIYDCTNTNLNIVSCNNESVDTESTLKNSSLSIAASIYTDNYSLLDETMGVVSGCYGNAIASGSLFSVDGTSTLYAINSSFYTAGAHWVTVATGGTLNYGTITILNPSTATVDSPTLTTTIDVVQVGGVSFDGGASTLNTTTLALGQVVIGQGNSSLSYVAAGADAVLITSNSGDASWLSSLTSGYVLISQSGSPPAWESNISSNAGAITTVDTDSGTVAPVSGVITISGGTTGLTTYAESGSEVSLEGTLAIGFGGTGVTSVTTAPTATAFAGWDSNKNLSANSFIAGYTTTATAGGTTTLTATSTQQQYFTGSTTQTVTLPITFGTGLVTGQTFTIVNLSSGVVTVETNNGNVLEAMAADTTLVATVVSTGSPGTGASSWSIEYGVISLTLPLSLANGGTGANLSSEVSNGGIFYSTASTGAILAGTATADQVLLSGGSSAPSWSSATYPSSVTANEILYASGSDVIGQITTADNGVLVTSGTGVPSISSTLPTAVQTNITELGTVTTGVWEGSVVVGEYGGTGVANTGLTIDLAYEGTGYVLTSDGSGNASWVLNPATESITTIDTDTGTVTPVSGVITISGGTTGLTTYAESGSEVSLEGTLAVGHGGTGVTSVTTAPTATAFAGWDSNKNLSANSFIAGYTTTATAGGTTTLTATSTQQQYFTGSTTQTVTLPITFGTGLVTGQTFTIVNLSSGVVTVETNNGNVLEAMAADTTLVATVVSTGSPGTGASSWSIEYGVISLTLPLSLANGGTGANLSSEVSNGGIFYSTASTGAILAGTATADQVLLSGASSAPSWSSATYPSSVTANEILYASGSDVIGQITTADNGVLVTSGTGVPSISSTLPTAVQTNITELGTVTTGVWEGSVVVGEYGGTGVANTGLTIDLAYEGTDYVLTSDGSGNASWALNPATESITTVDTDSGTVAPVSGVITISGGTTGLTTYAESGSEVSLEGTLAVGHGGTGVTSVTTAPTATAFAGWDSNKNLSANSFIAGYTTTATAGGTTTLTATSTQQQYFTGSTTQTVVLPVTTTLVTGQTFTIVNLSSGVVTVETNNGNVLEAMAADTTLVATVVSTGSPGTGASSWSIEYGTASLTLPLSLANGGTGANLSSEVSNGGIFYSTASTGAILAGTATADQVLLSGASSAPSWSSATYPSTTTANQILYSSASNTITGLTTADNGVLVTSGTGVPSISSTLPTAVQTNITELGTVTTGVWEGSVVVGEYGGTGVANTGLTINLAYEGTDYVLTSDGSGNASWALNPGTESITTVDTDSGTVTPVSGVITISGGTTGLTTYAATGSEVSLEGTLAVGHGGTGVTSVTTAPTATAFAGWDSNKNLSANSFIAGYTTTATAGGTTTLTATSTQQQYFTGSTTQTVVLPITFGTGLVTGQTFTIVNLSSGVVTVETNNGNVLEAMAADTTLVATVVSTGSPGTGASSWSIEYGVISLTLPLSLANGGTGANLSSEVSNGGIFYSTASTGAILAGTATVDQVLLSGASSAPSWSSATYPSTTTANQILYSSASNTITGLTTADNGVLITSGAGVPSISSTLPTVVQTNITELGTVTTGVWEGSVVVGEYGGTGVANTGLTIDLAYEGTDYVLTSDGSGNASWALNPGTGSITTVDTDSGTVAPVSGVITISGGTTGLTTYAESGSEVSLEGTLAIGFGGTGVTSVTTAPTATAFAGWDSNKNLSANSFIAGYTTTATAGGTTTLTETSTQQQYFTGSTTQTVTLPITFGTGLVTGQRFTIVNLSSGVVTVETNNGNVLEAMAADTTLVATVVSTGSPGTGASSWSIEYGVISLTLPLSLANGGTGANLSGEVSNGGIFYSTASTGAILAGTATADQVLLSGASSASSWSSATYPSTTTANQILYSSASNTITGLTTADNGVLITSSAGVPSISSTLPTIVQTNITELGTVTTGVWEGSVVVGEYGGTGVANTGLTIDLAYEGTGYVLTSDGSGNASWVLNPATESITTIDTDTGTVTPVSGVITISGGTTGLTTYAESGSEVSLEGTLAVGHGGTGVTSVTTAPTATAFAGWDSNKNLSANSFIAGYTTTATAGGTTTLTATSTQQQYFTGSTTQTVTLPITFGTGLVTGQTFTIVNLSSGVVTVETNNGNVLEAMAADTTLVATVVSTGSPGTGASSWSIEYGVISLTLPLSLANGGTGANLSSEVSNGGIFYSTASTGAILAGTATADQVLMSGASSAPSWSSATYPSSVTANEILYASGSDVIGQITTADNGVLVTSGTGVPSISSTLPTAVQTNITELGTVTTGVWEGSIVVGEYGGTGVANTGLTINLAYEGTDYVLTSDGSGNASWALNPGTGSITTVDTDSGTVTPISGVITISGGTTGLTTYAESGSEVSLEGTLAVGHGGTGVTSVTTAPTATAFAGWDSNKNLSANSFIAGYTTTATAGGTTTLTATSTQQQYFTGSTTQTVVLPVTTTLVTGQTFTIVNLSSGVVTVETNNGNVLEAMAADTTLVATVVSTGSPGTGASSWSIEYGVISLTLPLSLANGGTGANLSGEVSNGGIFYSTASTGAILAGTATADQVLLSGASGAPSWSSATYPSTTTANQILYSSASNTITGLTTADNGVLVTSGTGVPSISSTLPTVVQTNITELGTVTTGVWEGSVVVGEYGGTGVANTGLTIDLAYEGTDYVLTSDGSGNASWALNPGTGSITTVDTDSGTVTPVSGVITISGGTTGLTTYAATGSEVSLEGTLAIGFGGTGVTSVTTAPTATAFAGWDSNENLSANSFIAGYTTTATAGGTTTLTETSTQQQYFTGSTTQTVTLPITFGTGLVTGQRFTIVNLSSGVVTVETNNGNVLEAMAADTTLVATVVSTGSPGTGASSWSIEYGVISLTLPLSLANGGTGANLSGEVSNGGIFYSTASTGAILAGTATADQVLMSGASAAPLWSSATYPSTTTANQILYSSASNTVTRLATATSGVLITSSAGVPSILPNTTSGFVLSGQGTGTAPAWQALLTLDGDTGSVASATPKFFADQAAGRCGSSVTFSGSGSTLTLNLTDSSGNTIIGKNGGGATGNFTGTGCTSIGSGNLSDNGGVPPNTPVSTNSVAIGYQCLLKEAVSPGDVGSVAIGFQSLLSPTAGSYNACIGYRTGTDLLTGSYNTLAGYESGTSYTGSESSNICLSNESAVGDTNLNMIGTQGTSSGQQNKCFIAGIGSQTVSGSQVYINTSTRQVGLTSSSRRYKTNIQDMSNESSPAINLRPVTFNYNGDFDDKSAKQFGLIAEEVYEVMPEIVVLDEDNIPKSVRYEILPSLLLNEVQKLDKRVSSLEEVMALSDKRTILPITPVSSSYTVLPTDYFLECDPSTDPLTIYLPDIPQTGHMFVIKDATGHADVNHITITTLEGKDSIANSPSYILNRGYQSVSVLFGVFGYGVFADYEGL